MLAHFLQDSERESAAERMLVMSIVSLPTEFSVSALLNRVSFADVLGTHESFSFKRLGMILGTSYAREKVEIEIYVQRSHLTVTYTESSSKTSMP